MDAIALLRRDMALATTPDDQIDALRRGLIVLAPIVLRGELQKQTVIDAACEQAENIGLLDKIGSGAVMLEISKSLQHANGHASEEQKIVLTSAEFFKRLSPPDYLIEGIVQRRYMYSLTGATGTGKTAITLFLMASVCLGRPIGKIEVSRGGVIYFAGENPDDILYRWTALTQHFGTSPTEIDNAWFVPGVFRFSEIMDKIKEEMNARPIALAIIDTSASYFEGDDENSNAQLGEHARRMRGLIRLDGGPSIIINAHPGKYAQGDNLLPRGGGSFLAEMDGNLTCRTTDSAVELHWQGKFRGPDFAPINFRLETVTHELLRDTKGRLVPTVIAQSISEETAENIAKSLVSDENDVLASIRDDPSLNIRERGQKLGWLMRNNEPNRMKVQRAVLSLEKDGLIRKNRKSFEITEKGVKVVEKMEK